MKKIAIITDSSKNKGGAVTSTLKLKKNLENFFFVKIVEPNSFLFVNRLKVLISKVIKKIFLSKEYYLNSLNIFSTVKINELRKFDLIIIGWIGNETISIKDITKLNKPIIIMMNDAWFSNSTEHFTNEPIENYLIKECQKSFIKKKIYYAKKNFFKKKNIVLVTNSKWLFKYCSKSELTSKTKKILLRNPIKKIFFHSKNNQNKKIVKCSILFGTNGGLNNFRKGGDILLDALKYIDTKFFNYLDFIVLGSEKNFNYKINNFIFKFRKFTSNPVILRKYILRSSIIAMPSRAESLPQLAIEGLLSNRPVIAFNINGFSEVIEHKKNGYLAKPFCSKDFAKGLNFLINSKHFNNSKFLKNKREFSDDYVLKKLKKLINTMIIS